MKKLYMILVMILFSLGVYSQSYDTYTYKYSSNWGESVISYKSYNTDSILVQEGEYINQSPHGLWKMYSDGVLVSEMMFSYGDRIWLKTYDDGLMTKIYYRENKPYKTVAYID